ncbi:hypothetical protein MMC07_007208 [Pseudocyphellaria aurata]|nr:hypothetical protein [Pseudocyphellaria aurata]
MSPNPRGDAVVRWIVAIGVLDGLAVVLRLWVRKRNGTKIAADDWMVIASLVPAFCMIATASICVSKGGLGRHRADVTDSEMIILLKVGSHALHWCGRETSTKPTMSVFSGLNPSNDDVRPHDNRGENFDSALISPCVRHRRQVQKSNYDRRHFMPHLALRQHLHPDFSLLPHVSGVEPERITAANLLLDIVILCMPLPMIWDLNLSTRKKFEVSGVFLLGSFTCIASLLRILSIRSINDDDLSYTILNTYLWSHVEPATAIGCACLMTYGPLFSGVSPRLQSFIGGSKQNRFTKRLINIKLGSSSTGSDSEASQSLGRTMHGQEPADYSDLGAKTVNGGPHGFHVSVKPLSVDSRSSSSANGHMSMKPAVGRGSSLV